ncbi:Crp/Fnr family transcriptional regulator [Sphingomonas sp. S1-29]|uniref:Crp/Fnr family transcriptional regulator n=1 Tax=Sphingomonas sp. S1-29 TaxID=2991074 RepID=UPI00223E932A|nr:Crp/Fnr family transcriptional regulator [Sphingomonas sp. S1-29]UZK70655.1 Crp/Fnr family transcriptional regulator [Sphingomonas sp. S1-29]
MLRLNETQQIERDSGRRTSSMENRLIAALPREDGAALAALAQPMTLRAGEPAVVAGGAAVLWLPDTAVLSFGETLAERNVECGIVGAEGAIGWEPLIGLPQSNQRVAALVGGSLHAIPCGQAAALCDQRPAILAHLLRYRETLLIQMRWTIAARLQNGPDRRLARWLCMLHDRVEGDTLDITHLRLAAFLNARRASITDSLHVLEGERIVRCTRGKIFVRDRGALEAAAGPAYGPAEAAYAALFER